MLLQKNIINQYWHEDTVMVVNIEEWLHQEDNWDYTCNLKLLSYKDAEAVLGRKSFTDCFRPALKYKITLEEKNNALWILDKDKLMYAFAQKVIESILDDDWNETNILNGNIWTITCQDWIIIWI